MLGRGGLNLAGDLGTGGTLGHLRRRCDDAAELAGCRGVTTQPAGTWPPRPPGKSPSTIDRARAHAGWACPSRSRRRSIAIRHAFQCTPVAADSVGGSGNVSSGSLRRARSVFPKLLTASTPMAPGYGDGPITTRSARIGWPAFCIVSSNACAALFGQRGLVGSPFDRDRPHPARNPRGHDVEPRRPARREQARPRQEIAAVESEPMRVGLGDLHRELLVDIIAQRRLDEGLGIADELVLERVAHVMEHPVHPPAASADRRRGGPGRRASEHATGLAAERHDRDHARRSTRFDSHLCPSSSPLRFFAELAELAHIVQSAWPCGPMTHCCSLWKCFIRLSGSCSAYGGAKLAAQLPFDPAEQIELGVVGLSRRGRRALRSPRSCRAARPARESPARWSRSRSSRSLLSLNQGPTIGRSPRPGTRTVVALVSGLEQPGDRQRLPLAQLDDGAGASLGDRRDRAAVDRRSLGEIELADDGLDVQSDHVVGQDLGKEREDRAEPLELDGHHGRSARDRRALRHREREQPADQEPRGLSVECDQVGLGQDLGQALVRSASMNSEKWPESNTPKSGALPVGVAVFVAPTVAWPGFTKPGSCPWFARRPKSPRSPSVALLPAAEPKIDCPERRASSRRCCGSRSD